MIRDTITSFEFAVVFGHLASHTGNCLCSLADAGQTKANTHARGETHVRVSGRRGPRATSGSETPNTLRAINSLLGKWLRSLLVGRGALSCDLVPTFSVVFGARIVREGSRSISA